MWWNMEEFYFCIDYPLSRISYLLTLDMEMDVHIYNGKMF